MSTANESGKETTKTSHDGRDRNHRDPSVEVAGPKRNVGGSGDLSPPGLALSSTTSSISPMAGLSLETPKQPIQPKMTREESEKNAREFMENKGLNISYDQLDEFGKLRASRLMSTDFSWSPKQEKIGNHGETTFREQWELFCRKFPIWEDLSHVFFDEDALDNFLVIREQRGGICFMHAVTVYLHYLQYLRMETTRPNHEMLDLSWYICERFPKEKLEKFLLKGGGGSSIDFFCELTGHHKNEIMSANIVLASKSWDEDQFQQNIQMICDKFARNKEPALVSEFAIERNFKSSDEFSYDGELEMEVYYDYAEQCGKSSHIRVLHSMVLLGLRKEDSGKV